MKILTTIAGARRWRSQANGAVVLVPTMGALHRGHAALIARARKLAGPKGSVAVSVFVNPAQFGPREDFSRYPRSFAADRKVCLQHGAGAIFYPAAAEMYPPGFSTWVDEELVSQPLCGAARPGHFRGVCTVVLKLLQILEPDAAVFGRKDFQQCAVIQRMVRDLQVPVRLVFAETVREPDGLALSSRNAFLSPEERAEAPILRQAFLAAQQAVRGGEKRVRTLRPAILRKLAEAPLARVDYVEFVDGQTLAPVKEVKRGTVLAGAVFLGQTRLIDNLHFRNLP